MSTSSALGKYDERRASSFYYYYYYYYYFEGAPFVVVKTNGKLILSFVWREISLTGCFMSTASKPVAPKVESSSNLLD
jgi:hypothetical protein